MTHVSGRRRLCGGRRRGARLSRARALDAAARSRRSPSARSIFGAGGWPAAAVLFAFFIPSTLLSRVGRGAQTRDRRRAETGARSAWQVLANGGVAASCALGGLHAGAPLGGRVRRRVRGGVGRHVGHRDRHALARGRRSRFSRCARSRAGLSGGVTALGLAATGRRARSASRRLPRSPASRRSGPSPPAASPARCSTRCSARASRHCAGARRATASARRCVTCAARRPTLRRGASWLENDGVNFAATLCGALVAALLAILALR